METPVLVFQESLLSPWAQRPQSRRVPSEDAPPRFQTVGNLDLVNTLVAEGGLQKRVLLPMLVVDTVDCIEPIMPAKRRAVPTGISHTQAKSNRPKSSGQTAVVEEKSAAVEQEKVATKTSLIEFATFPGYTPSSPTPLPQSLDTMEQMRRVTRAQAKLAAKREGYREYWRENFYSPASQTVFLDTFWWFFLERYQPHREVQSALFSRVAENYVKFLIKTEIHTWKDKFLKAYPDAIAQCVYTAFIHAFPASWSSFDAGFKSALVEIVYIWQTGTRPMAETWKRWNFEYLDPPNSLKSIGQEEQQTKSSKQEKKFNLDALVEETRAAAKEEEPPVISTNEPRSRDSVESPTTTPTPSQQQTPSRCELEQAVSRELFRDSGMFPDGQSSPQRRGESSKLDIARSQYLSLKKERSNRPPHGRSTTITEMKSHKSGHHLTTMQRPLSSDIPVTKAQIPPPLYKTPKGTTNNNGHPKPGAAGVRQDSTQPHSMCHPDKETHVPKPHLHAPTQIEKPPGSLRLSTEAEELRRRSNVTVNTGGKKYVNRQKEKAPQLRQRPHQPPPRGRGQAKSTAGPGNLKRGETVVQMPPISKPPHQQPTKQPSSEGTTQQPPTEKPAGSCKPVSAAEEYGLTNYVFKEGEKEKTWKAKALRVREKSNQRPINILHKLHHQGPPLAVPELDSVCFNLFGSSPLVKHYLQKKQLYRVRRYAVLTKRTELNQVIPSGAPTYDDVIRESLHESKERSELLAAQKRQSKKQLQRILQDRLKKRQTYKRQLRQLLSAQKEVESLSGELVTYWEQRGVDKREGMDSLKHTLSPDLQRNLSSCINEAYQRCSTHHQTSA